MWFKATNRTSDILFRLLLFKNVKSSYLLFFVNIVKGAETKPPFSLTHSLRPHYLAHVNMKIFIFLRKGGVKAEALDVKANAGQTGVMNVQLGFEGFPSITRPFSLYWNEGLEDSCLHARGRKVKTWCFSSWREQKRLLLSASTRHQVKNGEAASTNPNVLFF